MEKTQQVSKKKLRDSVYTLTYISLVASFTFLILIQMDVNADLQQSLLAIGNAAPFINVTIEEEAATFSLTEGTDTMLRCNATITDNNGEDDIDAVNATFYIVEGTNSSSIADDNNSKYSDEACDLDLAFGSGEELRATCEFNISYYAFNGTWECNVTATDSFNINATGNDTILIDALVALSVPATMHFGTVDALNVSQENVTNVTNTGNIPIFIGFDGFGRTDGDNLSMNCSAGSTQNISIGFMKYNLTTSTGGNINLTEFENNYTNLTDEQINENNHTILKRTNNTNAVIGAINSTYWRVFVPLGVAGNCTGNIQYTAVVDNNP